MHMASKKVAFPKRGEVWWINFDPSVGTEIKKTRPAIIISNDASNQFLERVQVVPLTSSTDKIYPSECVVLIRGKKNKAAADQIATVSKKRVYKKIGQLSLNEISEVAHVIKVQLALS